MSLDATRWAWRQTAIRPTDKLVLLSLADRAGERHEAHPSIARLSADTCLNRKTVMESLRRLERANLIQGERSWGRGTHYRLVGVENRHETGAGSGTGAGNGTSTKNDTQPVPKTGPDQSQKRDTESTKNLPRTYFSTAGRPDAAKQGDGYSPEFEQAWCQYPKRQGDNPKRRAFRAWNARLRDGSTPQEMTAGTLRYARWCDVTGKTGTESVKHAATFFGPDKAFMESWKPPEAGNEANGRTRKLSPAEQIRQEGRELAAAGYFDRD